MKNKANVGTNLLFWAVVAAMSLYLFGSDLSGAWGRQAPTTPNASADTTTTETDNFDSFPPTLSVFVPDSVFLSGINVCPINCKFIFVRDSFDPETVRPVGGIFSIVNN